MLLIFLSDEWWWQCSVAFALRPARDKWGKENVRNVFLSMSKTWCMWGHSMLYLLLWTSVMFHSDSGEVNGGWNKYAEGNVCVKALPVIRFGLIFYNLTAFLPVWVTVSLFVEESYLFVPEGSPIKA